MKALVTGSAGFIGSHVCKHCLKHGMEVIGLDDLSGGFKDNNPPGIEFIEASITDVEAINALFRKHRFDVIYHLAAYAAEGLSHFIRRFNYENNVIGSINLINAAVNTDVRRFVFASSIAVYGTGQTPMVESMIPAPEDPYGVAKYAVEMDLMAAREMFGLEYTIFRPHNVYGENQNLGDRYRNVLGIFMNQIMSGLPMTIFGDGSQSRAFSHIDEVAPIIANCVNLENSINQVYNIGADQPYTVLELAKLVAKAFGSKENIKFLDARKEVLHAFADHTKIHHDFGPQGRVSIEDGIGRMAEWAKVKGPRKSSIFSQVEIAKNLPASWKGVVPENRSANE